MSKKHTPGPWQWYKRHDGTIYLATPHSGHLIVMDFVRRGMRDAQPRFAVWGGDERERMGGVMANASELADGPGGHPDGRLIAEAPELLKTLRAAVQALRSYQFGNGSPDLAKEIADYAEAVIAGASP